MVASSDLSKPNVKQSIQTVVVMNSWRKMLKEVSDWLFTHNDLCYAPLHSNQLQKKPEVYLEYN